MGTKAYFPYINGKRRQVIYSSKGLEAVCDSIQNPIHGDKIFIDENRKFIEAAKYNHDNWQYDIFVLAGID